MKRTLLFLGSVLLILLILGFIAPQEYVVQHTVEVNAPRKHVYEFINTLERLSEWKRSPEDRPALNFRHSGTPGTVGSILYWNAIRGLEAGREEIMHIVPLSRIETRIRTSKPWESLNHSFIEITGSDHQCRVTWRYEGHNPFPFNIKHLFVKMEKAEGPFMWEGLLRLKRKAEIKYLRDDLFLSARSMEERELYVGHRRKEHLSNGFSIWKKDSRKMGNDIDSLVLDSASMTGVLWYGMDKIDTVTFSIFHEIPLVGSWIKKAVRLPSAQVIKGEYIGGYGGLVNYRRKMDQYIDLMGKKRIEPTLVEFGSTPMIENDSTKWQTMITYRLIDK